jgi:hypothetical protein
VRAFRSAEQALTFVERAAPDWRRNEATRGLKRGLAYIGAPRSMKMGNIRSPSRYDVGGYGTLPSLKMRRPTIPRYASSQGLFSYMGQQLTPMILISEARLSGYRRDGRRSAAKADGTAN